MVDIAAKIDYYLTRRSSLQAIWSRDYTIYREKLLIALNINSAIYNGSFDIISELSDAKMDNFEQNFDEKQDPHDVSKQPLLEFDDGVSEKKYLNNCCSSSSTSSHCQYFSGKTHSA